MVDGGWEMKGEGMAGGNGLPSIEGSWQGLPLHLFHEPLLLETGGGVKNIEAWAAGESVLVHNGDIFSSLPLEQLVAAHEASGLPVTLALRSEGVAKHIALDGDRAIDREGQWRDVDATPSALHPWIAWLRDKFAAGICGDFAGERRFARTQGAPTQQ